MRVKLTIEPDGIPDIHIYFTGDTDDTEAVLVCDSAGVSQPELAGTLLDLAQTIAGASVRAETPRPRFNPQPRARGLS